MTSHSQLGALALVLALTACGDGAESPSGSDGVSPTRAQVASRARDFVRPEPGLYRSTVEVLEVDIPGAPPQMAEMIRESGQTGQTNQYCVTPADVEKGFEEAVRKSQRGDCDYQRFDVDGGKIEAAMTCIEAGRSVNLTLSGSGDSTSSDMSMTMKLDMAGMGEGTIRARSRSERIGECPS